MSGKGRLALVSFVVAGASNSFGTMILSAMARPQVGMVTQCNVVVWNPVTKMEHLTQSSVFVSQAKRFEFLVPTPTIPKVKEVGNAPIDFVSALINPPRPPRPVVKPNPDDELDSSYGVLIRPKVEVKQVTYVGNLKATTICASDVVALANWMEKNGYKASQSQNEWLERYVQKRWFITAFQVNSESNALKTSAVRLSFKSDLPFVPYTSPRNNWVAGVKQEIFLVTPAAMQGTTNRKSVWAARQTGHKFLSKSGTVDLSKRLGLSAQDIPAFSWVSRYIDESPAESVSDDLIFLPAPKGIKKK
jgi:Uncharacterized protein conserved in bacteria (DUF2330)